MLFNSYGFLFVFLPVVLLLYWSARTADQKKLISVVASYIFYGVWSVKFAALMFFTTGSDYVFARLIGGAASAPGVRAGLRRRPDLRTRRRRLWLALSLGLNLGVLAIFKYYDFFAGALNSLSATLSPSHPAQPLLPLLHMALPIGISFYTFESMSYVIDVYQEKVQAAPRFLDYAHFVTMFPRLVAGPIARYTDVVAQLRDLPARLDWGRAAEAIHFFTLGLAKKLLVADPLAVRLVDPLFKNPSSLGLVDGWLAALGYTVQIYMDFSGYSDMAVGLALLLGFRLPRNFNLPYASASVAEFWRRWHITLSNWLRDYLFIPLGGSRRGPGHTSLNYFITMLLGGLWHGANWTFVIWGAFQGAGLALSHRLDRTPAISRIPKALRVAVTFVFTVAGWVIFRAPNVRAALSVFQGMLGRRGFGLGVPGSRLGPVSHVTLITLAAGLLIGFTVDTWDVGGARADRRRALPMALAYGFLLVVCVAQLAAPSPFIYFQF